MITTQLPDGTAVHHQHDQAGRLTYNKYTDGSWEAWEYDKAGRLTKAYNRDSVTEFVRNALGQVIKETQDGRTVEHRYDERSRPSNIVSALEGNITYGYDMKGSVNHISAGMSGKRKPWEANIAYDRFGRETSRMMPGCVENTMHYDSIGRPAHQRVRHNGRTLYDKSYTWGDNLRLLRTFDTINGRSVRYDYDAFGSLSGAVYGDGSRQWRNPDAMGNVYDSPDRTDRSYGRGGQLREDRKWRYYYDSHGNLVLKTMRRSGPSLETGMRDEFLAWQSGDYAYTWQGNGMLRSVTRPDGKTITFKYDALGRRIEKVFDGRVYRYLWDGDVILHEWDYAEADRPNTVVTETGEVTLDRTEPVENPITWVYDSDSYVPTAKIVGDRHYSIVSDYIGRPVQAYDDKGNVVWQADYDIYGNLRNLHGSRQFIPFRQLGQYEDEETGLYYNRFRYYDPKIGNYISQDPIRLAGNNPTLYAFVSDSNLGVDVLGLTTQMVGDMPMGKWGEKVAAKYLKKEGHTILGSIQNASGHGFDLVTKTADGYINVIEVKTSGNKWRSKSNMGGWTRKNIEKITGNTNGMWASKPKYQDNLLTIIRKAQDNRKLNNKLFQINIEKRSIRLRCK